MLTLFSMPQTHALVATAALDQLSNEEKRLEQTIEQQKAKAEQEAETVAQYQRDLEHQRRQVESIPLDIQLLEAKQQELQKDLGHKQKAMEIQKREKELQLQALNKAISVFSAKYVI
jgi:chromosome segregation ATPase